MVDSANSSTYDKSDGFVAWVPQNTIILLNITAFLAPWLISLGLFLWKASDAC